MKNIAKLLTLLAIIGLAGCGASNKDLESVRALAQQANTTANEALATARSAESTAQDAKATADATEIKIDRMAKEQKPARK